MEKILIDNETTAMITSAQVAIDLHPDYRIQTQGDAITLKTYNESLVKIVKALESKRLELTKPLRENVDEINAKISPIVKRLDALSKSVNKIVYDWQTEQARIAADARRKQLLKQTTASPAPVVVEQPKITKTRKVTKIEVIGDIKDVDPEYTRINLDTDKIDAAIKAGRLPIKGLKIWQDKEPVRG